MSPHSHPAKLRIAQAFEGAAASYDQRAIIQRRNALALAAQIRDFLPPDAALGRIVDLGCGTGFLSTLLAGQFPQSHFVLCDISAGMLDTAAARLAQFPTLTIESICGDAEVLAYTIPADLVVSNFCAQWFQDPLASLAHHLQHTRFLAWTTLLEGTFSSWNDALISCGLKPGTQRFLAYHELEKCIDRLSCIRSTLIRHHEYVTYPSALAFLRELRAIGAYTALPHHKPQYLRRVLRRHEAEFRTEYQLATIIIEAA